MRVFATESRYRNIKRFLLTKENQTSQGKEFTSLFYVWEDTRVWDCWNDSFDVPLCSLGPVSHLSPSRGFKRLKPLGLSQIGLTLLLTYSFIQIFITCNYIGNGAIITRFEINSIFLINFSNPPNMQLFLTPNLFIKFLITFCHDLNIADEI